MAILDTEEKIIADLAAVVRRAVALGRRMEKDAVRVRLQRAIDGESSETKPEEIELGTSAEELGDRTRAIEEATAHLEQEMGRYPYGHVKKSVATAIYKLRATGATRQEIGAYCGNKLSTPLTDSAVQTALKTLTKDGMARYRSAKQRWYPTQELIEKMEAVERQKHDAPELIAQGHLAERNS